MAPLCSGDCGPGGGEGHLGRRWNASRDCLCCAPEVWPPLLCCARVMERECGAIFAQPRFSTDNAMGTAILTWRALEPERAQ